MNRTGARTDIKRTEELIQGAQRFWTQASNDQADLYKMRTPYIKAGARVGSQIVQSDKRLSLLLDKMSARLVFESQGARLYQILLQKHAAAGADFPRYSELERHAFQEQNHFVLLQNMIFELGGDPTAITPAADVTSVISSGVLKVIADPRTTMAQSLEALLTAELVDNDSWELLITIAREQNRGALLSPLEQALNEEREHLANVRGWIQQESKREMAA
jgi:hypothetical protein